MKINQNQLEYLMERGKNYDRKYRMFKMLIDKIPNKLNVVLELFGGVGIQSYYLQKYKNIETHTVIERDYNCYKIAKKLLKNVKCIHNDCFQYSYDGKVDLLVCDSVFNQKEFENVTSLVNKFDFDYLILTVTGVFNVRFNKNMTYDEYWNNLIEKLQNKGLYVSDIIYSSDFGISLIKKENTDCHDIIRLDNNDLSTMWRNYVEEIKNSYEDI